LPKHSLLFLVLPALFVAFVVLKINIFMLDEIRLFPDTTSYIHVSQLPWLEMFWGEERPFTIPLIYKSFQISGYSDLTLMAGFQKITHFQMYFSIFSWLFLALVISRTLSTPWAKIMVFPIILGFGLSLDISQWDRMLLSESVSASLFSVLLGLMILNRALLWDFAKLSSSSSVKLGLLIIVALLYSGTRDVNTYFILALALIILSCWAYRSITQRRLEISTRLYFALALIVISLTQFASSSQGERWFWPFANVFYERIRLDQETLDRLIEEGLPVPESTERLLRGFTREEYIAFLNSSDAADFRNYLLDHGKEIYLKYLLMRPLRTLGKPILAYRQLLGADSSEYRYSVGPTPDWAVTLSEVFFPNSWQSALALALIPTIGIALINQSNKNHLHLFLPLALLLTLYPLMFLVFHGDAIEIERHAFQISLQIRLAGWMLLIYFLDSTPGLIRIPG